jgi:hypothetical protein
MAVCWLFIDLKKAYDLFAREVLCNFLIKVSKLVKLFRLEIRNTLKNVAKLKDKLLEQIENGWRS